MSWEMREILKVMDDEILGRLSSARKSLNHPVLKGDATEFVWVDIFNRFLPERYRAERAVVADSENLFSDQIDVVIFDRQYSPFVLEANGQRVVPAESVYAVFEAKQSLNASNVAYAMDKAESVRRLHQTSLPIPHAGGEYPPKPPIKIIAGVLTLESDWAPAFSSAAVHSLRTSDAARQIDIGVVVSHGYFVGEKLGQDHKVVSDGLPAASFVLKLISMLQRSGTVPMIDVMAYARWAAK
jgi:hypothetical protein